MTESGLDDLARAARAGSREAFGAIYDRTRDRLVRVLASYAGPDPMVLEDLVHDVYVRVAERLHAYDPERPFAPWLFTIALNVGRNHARVRREEAVERKMIEPDPRVATDEALLAVTDLMRDVSGLPLSLRDVVALRIGSDLGYDEIAALLGIPVGTARRRMHDALNILRDRELHPSRTGGTS